MALINCPECKSAISTEAVACPNCGLPTPIEKTIPANLQAIIIVMQIFAIIACWVIIGNTVYDSSRPGSLAITLGCIFFVSFIVCKIIRIIANGFIKGKRSK